MAERNGEAAEYDANVVVYTNLLRTIPSPFDFALDFGYIRPRPPDTPREPPPAQVRVVMSWEYAKLLRDALGEAIAVREGNVGEIKEPPGILRIEETAEAG
jgi:Protein of unknown function (DUF3467)